MANGFDVLHDGEVQDFYASIKRLGFDEKDFLLSQTPLPSSGGPLQVIAGNVIVMRKSTGAEKTYVAGHRSFWPASFHDDLAKGVFGAR